MQINLFYFLKIINLFYFLFLKLNVVPQREDVSSIMDIHAKTIPLSFDDLLIQVRDRYCSDTLPNQSLLLKVSRNLVCLKSISNGFTPRN